MAFVAELGGTNDMIGMTDQFVLLRDGGQALIRPFHVEDRDAVKALFARISPDSRVLRFHTGGTVVDEALVDVVTGGHVLVALRGDALVALASYAQLRDAGGAEMAIVVDDAEQGRGIGTALFERLSEDARREGITHFLAEVLADNGNMLRLLRGLGFQLKRTVRGGELEVAIQLRADSAYVERADTRRHVAAIASLEPIFHPRVVAVIGASRRPGSIGHALFHNLLTGGFAGTVYPVNPHAASIGSVHAYPTVAAIPEPVDLAVIVVPAGGALAAARECLQAGVRGLIVITAGFAEVGAAGRRLQDELLTLCRAHGARLVGPNCMGVLSYTGADAMNATFAPTLPPPGSVAIASQSGALGIAILEQARQLGLGISSFVSVGNKADLSSNDLLECWEEDAATKVIVLYLESFGNPRRFGRIARRVGTRKAIVAVKGGRSRSGRRAAASHTAALAGADVAVDALFRQAGVTRCDTLEELFEVSTLLANQPLPAGNRVGVLTNAGGLGILCADACEANGLLLPELTDLTQAALKVLLPPEASVANPVDMLASGSAESYGEALRILLADPLVDSVIILFIPPLVTRAADVAAALIAACDPAPSNPVLACFVGAQGTPPALRGAVVIPSYTFPESAARALGHAVARATWLRRLAGTIPPLPSINAKEARAVLVGALAREDHPWLTADEVTSVLQAYGITTPEGTIARNPEEAADACRHIGAPVAVKLVSRTVLHKSDVGGVHLNVASPAAAADAYRAIADSLQAHGVKDGMDGVLVQPMLREGVECLIGVVTDPIFGPLIAFGSGGMTAEVLGDVAFRLSPLTDLDAEELIAGTKVATLLRGYRGSPAADVSALRDLLLRVSLMVEDCPEMAEMDLNPVLVRRAGQGAVVLDARMRLSAL
jgi:acetyl coenzyme A synthetase (ADP forming)-like protein